MLSNEVSWTSEDFISWNTLEDRNWHFFSFFCPFLISTICQVVHQKVMKLIKKRVISTFFRFRSDNWFMNFRKVVSKKCSFNFKNEVQDPPPPVNMHISFFFHVKYRDSASKMNIRTPLNTTKCSKNNDFSKSLSRAPFGKFYSAGGACTTNHDK